MIVGSANGLKVEYDPTMPSIDISLSLDCGKAKKELDWRPKIGLYEGIERTLKWYRDNSKHIFD